MREVRWLRHSRGRFFASLTVVDGRCPVPHPRAGLKSLFQKSPLKNRAVHGATIYNINPPVNT